MAVKLHTRFWPGFYLLTALSLTAEDQVTLRGVITDAVTGLPTPCSVTITDANGKTIIERESYKIGFRCDGRFEKQLPPGRTRIRVSRGLETRATTNEVFLTAGITTNLQLILQRQVNLRQRGWYAGDSHVHMIHGEKTIPVDFDFVALTAQAEDLHYLSLSHAWQMVEPSPEKLDAELGRRSTPDCVLTWNLEAPKNYYRGDANRCLGHCWNLALQGRTPAGMDIIQLLLEASAGDYESAKATYANFEIQALIHAQGGRMFYTHPARWWTGSWGGQGGYPRQDRMRISNMAVELPLDTLIGPTFDGLDVITSGGEFGANQKAFQLWALLLNHGYRLAATGSSDACFDRPGGAVPGAARTYTYLDGDFSLPAVAKATAKGRTFVTTGPLLLVSVNNQPPGSSYTADGKQHLMRIEAWPSGADQGGLTKLEILRNGKTQSIRDFASPIPYYLTNLPIQETEAAWYCVRLYGGDPQRQRAISGAFYFDPAPYRPPPPVPTRIRAHIIDAETGRALGGTLVEVAFWGALQNEGPIHSLPEGKGIITIPATFRVRAEANGYAPLTLSPFLDSPEIVETITHLEDSDLLNWKTYERIRELLANVSLTFALNRLK